MVRKSNFNYIFYAGFILIVFSLSALAQLISCPDCDRQVSIRAQACPQCGGPIAQVSPPPSQSGYPFGAVPSNERGTALFQALRDGLVLVSTKNSRGSGFAVLYDQKLYILTNAHVVNDADTLNLDLLDGTRLRWSKIEFSNDRDVARILIENPPQNLRHLSLSKSNPRMGSSVFVYGDSQGSQVATAVQGKILGVGPIVLETDAPFVQGNSGSPIIDQNGEVVAIATYATRTAPISDWVSKGTRFERARRFGVRLSNITWVHLDQANLKARVNLIDDLNRYLSDAYMIAMLFHPSVVPEIGRPATVMFHSYRVDSHGARYNNMLWPQLIDEFCDSYELVRNLERAKPNIDPRWSPQSHSYINAVNSHRERLSIAAEKTDEHFQEIFDTPLKALSSVDWTSGYLISEAKNLHDLYELLHKMMKEGRQSDQWGRRITAYFNAERRRIPKSR